MSDNILDIKYRWNDYMNILEKQNSKRVLRFKQKIKH